MPNGMVAVFDENKQQVQKFQGFLFDIDFRELGKFVDYSTKVCIGTTQKVEFDWWLERSEAT